MVEPDLLAMTKSTPRVSPIAARTASGSTESSMRKRGKPGATPTTREMTSGARLEPPMPSSSTSVNPAVWTDPANARTSLYVRGGDVEHPHPSKPVRDQPLHRRILGEDVGPPVPQGVGEGQAVEAGARILEGRAERPGGDSERGHVVGPYNIMRLGLMETAERARTPGGFARAIVICGVVGLAIGLAACGREASAPADTRAAAPARRGSPPVHAAPTAAVPAASAPRIVFLGDSLTAGYGIEKSQAVPALVQARLAREGYPFEVVNAGVSGDTSAGGLSRLDWSLSGDVRILVLALGANDGLRGLPVASMRRNLEEIVTRAQARGIAVLLVGMEALPNYGAAYTREFRETSTATSRERTSWRFMPFYLDGVAGNRALNIADGIHPNPKGAAIVADSLWPFLEPLLTAAAASPAAARIPMIELRGVSKTVQSGDHPLTILHPLDYSIASGEFVAVVGPSGSGKSTLLGLLAGLDAPSTGHILVDGIDITSLSEDGLAKLRGEKIGFVFQFFHLVPSLTAVENIAVPMEIVGRRDAMARARQLIAEVGLADRAHHYPSQLSGGEQQRIAIARALANDPPIVLADEPTGNLDSGTGRIILDLLLNVRRTRKATLVLVTHDQELAALADTRLTLRDGRQVDVPVGAPPMTLHPGRWRCARFARRGGGCCSSSSASPSASGRSSRSAR